MSYVRRNDGSMTLRGSQRTRVVPLIGTFLLLMAGFVVSAPGLMRASALGPNPVDLALTKSDDGLVKVAGGDSFDYTITVQNVGGSDLPADAPVTVTDELPNGLVFVAFPANCAQAGQTLTCSIDPADLDVYAGLVVITVTVMASADTASDAYTNVAYVDTPQDPACEGYGCVPVCDGYSNNVDCESTTIERPETTLVVHEADLSIDKSVSQSTAVAGNQFNWFLAVTNHGPDPATNLVVNDALPAQFEVIGVFPPAGVSCTNTTSTVRCTAAGLLIDKTVTVQVQVRVVAGAAAGLVANTGTVTADSPDPVPGNNSDTATITITTTAVASEAPAPAAPAAVSPELPATGNRSLGWPLSLAGLLCSAGVLSLIIARRRRFATA